MTPIHEIKIIEGVKYKKCNFCELIKPIWQYNKCNTIKSGIRGDCKICEKARRKTPTYQPRREKNRKLLQKYSITLEQYEEMLQKQGNRCWICGRHKSEFQRPLHVDHNHTTGKVRGLLCGVCNRGLGSFGDSISRLERAIYYLETNYGNSK